MIKAATRFAAAYNIKSNEPVLLKDSNNTVIHLAPSPVVAKVATESYDHKSDHCKEC